MNTILKNHTLQRDFDPSDMYLVSTSPCYHFRYRGMLICWTAEKNDDNWFLVTSIDARDVLRLSFSEYEGILRETGFDLFTDYETLFRPCLSDPSKVLVYFTQTLPDEPLLPWDRLRKVDMKKDYEKDIKAMLTLDPALIRKAMGKPESYPDKVLIVTAHKCLAASPFVDRTRKMESVKWLHRHGYHVTIQTTPSLLLKPELIIATGVIKENISGR